MRHEKLPRFDVVYLWKRRGVTAPSAPQTNREEHLYVLWNNRPSKGPERPTKCVLNDPIFSSLWIMETGWCYAVGTTREGFFKPELSDVLVYAERSGAVHEYRRRVKDLTRSKEVDYGFPWADTSVEEGE